MPQTSSDAPARLLIVDDEAAQMKALCDVLTTEGYSATGFVSANQALEQLRSREFDVLLTDLMMPEMDGIELLAKARELSPDIVAVVMTGHAAIDTAVKAMQAGALDYIVKPFKLNGIRPVVNRAIAVRRLRQDNKRLEENVQLRTRELEVANRELAAVNEELKAFSYSVSHDLRAPLRTMTGFCEIYIADYGTTIPPDGQHLLGTVLAAGKRMGQIIEDLLALSQLGRQRIVRQRIKLGDLVQRIVADLRALEPSRQVNISIGELGECQGDASLLEQVFVNLLSNAFKFTAKQNDAKIEIGRRESDESPVYFVRDNGAGFDMRYIGKLFGIFQRLHSAQEFQGTGVGLSIVQRIIRRHGGRIWAESAPGEGATFSMTIPPEPPARVE